MARPELCLIAAVARNGIIGSDNSLPWRLREDMRHFKALTLGCPVVMGRKTWDSLGRPLPGRRNLVISRQTVLAPDGAEVFPSLESALAACSDVARVFVIGGGQIYAQALPLADRVYLSEVAAEVPGDTHFPALAGHSLREVSRRHVAADEFNEYDFDIVEYIRDA
ncbi:MAG: dihydrofolate reductase [Betaproteobacteria bacterium]|nr:dihydrofolate reductase [Betaproteobacteria bacterium]